MPIGLKEKQAIVAEVNETASAALSAVMADYRGVSVDGMTELRKVAREQNVHVQVIRNTLAKRAFEGTEFECMNEVSAWTKHSCILPRRPWRWSTTLQGFCKRRMRRSRYELLAVGGKLLAADQIDALAKLPTRDQAFRNVDVSHAGTSNKANAYT